MLGNPSAPGASTIAVLFEDVTSMEHFDIMLISESYSYTLIVSVT